MPYALPTSLNVEDYLHTALSVPTGIEVEFSLDICDGWNECYCGDRCCSGGYEVDASDYAEEHGYVTGWESGWDGGYAEMRSARPTPLGDQPARLQALVNWFRRSGIQYEMDEDNSYHVHINTNPSVGPAASVEHLCKAYDAMRSEARALVENSYRTESSWCQPYTDDFLARNDWRPVALTKSYELNYDAHFGTVELRLWDATDDPDLIERRFTFLKTWIATAFAIEEYEVQQAEELAEMMHYLATSLLPAC